MQARANGTFYTAAEWAGALAESIMSEHGAEEMFIGEVSNRIVCGLVDDGYCDMHADEIDGIADAAARAAGARELERSRA